MDRSSVFDKVKYPVSVVSRVHDPLAGTPSALDETVFDYSFLFPLTSSFLDSSRFGTATFSKQMATKSFRMLHEEVVREGQNNLANAENNENFYLTINCKSKNLNFEVFRLTLAYFQTIVQLYFA